MDFKKTARFLSALGMLALMGIASAAQAEGPPMGDFDGGGRSDLSAVTVDKKKSTTAWVVRSSETGALSSYGFGVPADALVIGRFYGGTRSYPGVVWVRDAKKPLEWHIKTPYGTENFIKFGLPGDIIPNMGDLDGDGTTDLVVVRAEGNVLAWYVALSSQPGVIYRDIFGVPGDHPATAEMDGNGSSRMVVLRSGFYWYTKKLGAADFTTTQWGLPGDIPLLPQDVNHNGSAEFMISRRIGGTQTAFIRLENGQPATRALGLASSIPLVGNFIGDPYFAWFQRDQGLIGVGQYGSNPPAILPFGGTNQWIVRPDGSVITPTDDGVFGTANIGNGGNGGNGGGTSSDVLHCDAYVKLPDGRNGNKYNANNSRHAAKLIWNTDLVGEIDHVSGFVNGLFFTKFHNMGFELGGRPWWNSDRSINDFTAGVPLTAVAYLNDGTTSCMYIPDPRETLD